jgi:hypothetical protein
MFQPEIRSRQCRQDDPLGPQTTSLAWWTATEWLDRLVDRWWTAVDRNQVTRTQ